MSIVLIRPNLETELFKIHSESLTLGYLSAVLREKGIETNIIDAYLENINLDDLVQRVIKKRYKIVGFTIYNDTSLEWTAKAAELIKKENPEIHIIIGGHTPSFDYKYILQKAPKIDSIARFEGEYILFDLAKAILNKQDWRGIKGLAFRNNGKIASNELATIIPNLDDLPFPERDYLIYLIENYWEEYTVSINRGRGCYRKCSFCSVPKFFSTTHGRILRQRSNENLSAEIENLVNTYHVNNFTFIDDVFINPSEKGILDTIALVKEINIRGLKINFSIAERIDNLNQELVEALISAGLVRIFVGLEATTQNILNKLDKRLSKKMIEDTMSWLLAKNIDIEISFINFLPFNSLQDIRENIIFFSEWGLDTLRSLGNRLEPYPGTLLHYTLEKNGNLKRDRFFYDYVVNTVDPRVDILFEIIKTSIPFLALVSYKLRYVKSLLWKVRDFIKDFNLFYEQLLSLQRIFVYEARDIFLSLISELESQRKMHVNSLRNEIYKDVTTKAEWWLICLLEIKKRIKNEVSHEKTSSQLSKTTTG